MELSDQQVERYARHLILDQIDELGQQKILSAKVLVIGAGGIGSPTLLYLTAAGVGEIHIVDMDTVDLSNLQRQVIFQTHDLNKPKVNAAVESLCKLNAEPKLVPHQIRIDETNAASLISDMTLVIDGSDTYETRQLVARFCLFNKVPLVSSAATQFEGQLAIFRPWLENRPCYECLFPVPPRSRMSCAEAGVFGPLLGIMGTIAANESLKLILNIPVNDQQLLLVNGLDLQFTSLKAQKRKSCVTCT